MSIDGKTYLGYCINILDDFNELPDRQKEKLTTFDEYIKQGGTRERLQELNFKHYWGELYDPYRYRHKPNTATIIYDGMNGFYCYLLHIVAYLNSADYEMEDNDIDGVSLLEELNKALAAVKVPDEIINELKEVYKEIFGKELENAEEKIRLSYFIHWT